MSHKAAGNVRRLYVEPEGTLRSPRVDNKEKKSESIIARPLTRPSHHDALIAADNSCAKDVHLLAKKKAKPKEKSRKTEGWNKTIKKHVGHAASWLWDVVYRRIFGATQKLAADRAQLVRLSLLEKEMYFKDNKDYVNVKLSNPSPATAASSSQMLTDGQTVTEQKIQFCDDQIRLLKQEMQASMKAAGLHVIKISFPVARDAYRIATVTTGVVNNVFTVNPSDSTEWATMILLFEEYKMTGLTVQTNEMLYCKDNTSTTLNNSQCVSVADPADLASTLASVAAGAQFQYKDFVACGVHGPSNGARRGIHVWDIKLPPGQFFNDSGASLYTAQDTWLAANPTITVYPAYCAIKHYTVQLTVTATNVTSALMTYHYEFRTRQ